uniref:Uncharacterized protein n=1 Tax=Anguilla anguilla TaxID=7936 RepID=A0A0E9WLI5_ANGAN
MPVFCLNAYANSNAVYSHYSLSQSPQRPLNSPTGSQISKQRINMPFSNTRPCLVKDNRLCLKVPLCHT